VCTSFSGDLVFMGAHTMTRKLSVSLCVACAASLVTLIWGGSQL
jgi:hypothetical protein